MLFLEEYFESASIKFEIAFIEAEKIMKSSCLLASSNEDSQENNIVIFMIECCNNIATCYFKCSTNSSMHKAIEFCTLGIEKQTKNQDDVPFTIANIYYRRAQAYDFLYSFVSSESDLKQAKTILTNLIDNYDDNDRKMKDDAEALLGKVERYIRFIEFRKKQFGNIIVS